MKNSLKQSTYLNYESYIRVHFKPALGGLILRDLSPRILQQYYNYKSETEGLAPKTQNSLRTVPLLPTVVTDLQNWAAIQKQDQLDAGEGYDNSGYIVTNPSGGFIEPRTFKDYYDQILKISGLRHFTFHALRHTFASRAMEQGMDAKTLSMILGHYSVSFTLDTYTHVLDNHKHEEMALMEELYNMAPISAQSNSYPLVITTQEDGTMFFTAPDFPAISFAGEDLQGGIQYIKERIEEELLTSAVPPMATPMAQIPMAGNQMLMQIAI